MKKHDPEEVHQMRESLKQFSQAARTVAAVQAKLRESFTPPPDLSEAVGRLYVPCAPKTA